MKHVCCKLLLNNLNCRIHFVFASLSSTYFENVTQKSKTYSSQVLKSQQRHRCRTRPEAPWCISPSPHDNHERKHQATQVKHQPPRKQTPSENKEQVMILEKPEQPSITKFLCSFFVPQFEKSAGKS